MSKGKRPTLFYHGHYAWIIKYFNAENEDHGKTLFDCKEIHIFTKNKDEATIRDTVLHEIEHVINEDIIKTVKMMCCNDDVDLEELEEQYIVLTTPRRMLTYSSNPELLTYLFNYKEK